MFSVAAGGLTLAQLIYTGALASSILIWVLLYGLFLQCVGSARGGNLVCCIRCVFLLY